MTAVLVVLSLLVPAAMAVSPFIYRRTRPPTPPPQVGPVAFIGGRERAHRLNPETGESFWADIDSKPVHEHTPR